MMMVMTTQLKTSQNVGAWRSLVAYLNGVQRAGGSNPLAPTISFNYLYSYIISLRLIDRLQENRGKLS